MISQVTNSAFGRQAFGGGDGFETVTFALVLTFAAVLSGFAVAVAFAVVHVVAMHGVVGCNGFALGAFGGVSGKSTGRQSHNSGSHGERSAGSGFHKKLLEKRLKKTATCVLLVTVFGEVRANVFKSYKKTFKVLFMMKLKKNSLGFFYPCPQA